MESADGQLAGIWGTATCRATEETTAARLARRAVCVDRKTHAGASVCRWRRRRIDDVRGPERTMAVLGRVLEWQPEAWEAWVLTCGQRGGINASHPHLLVLSCCIDCGIRAGGGKCDEHGLAGLGGSPGWHGVRELRSGASQGLVVHDRVGFPKIDRTHRTVC